MEKFAKQHKTSDQPLARKAGLLAGKMVDEFHRRSANAPTRDGPPRQGPPPKR